MARLYAYPPTPVSVSIPPTSYQVDSVTTPVNIDTSDASNSTPLPSLLYIDKDGEKVAIHKDTGDSTQTVAIPVEIVAADGTNINITAGDINVQMTDLGVNFDALRVGDGSGNYIGVNSDSEALVHDTDAVAALESIDSKSPALVGGKVPVDTGLSQPLTDAQLRAMAVPVSGTVSTGGLTDAELRAAAVPVSGPLTNSELRASAVPVSGPLTDTQLRATAVDVASTQLPASLGQKTAPNSLSVVLASGTSISATITGGATEAKQDSQITLTGALTETAPATDTASSGLNGRLQRIAQRISSLIALLPTSLGQKTSANSLAVVLPSDQVVSTAPSALAATYQEILNLTTTAQTITAPAGAKWCKVMTDDTNAGNVRVKIGGTATTTSGMQFQSGRSEDFQAVGNISVIAESGTNNKVYVQFGA